MNTKRSIAELLAANVDKMDTAEDRNRTRARHYYYANRDRILVRAKEKLAERKRKLELRRARRAVMAHAEV